MLPVNRARPITVTGFDVGVNFNFDPSIVEFQWNQNPELDIIGYRVYDLGPDNTLGNGNDTLICSTSKAIDTSCTTSLPSDTPTYGVVALDLTDITDTGSVVRESQYAVKKTLSKTQPASPTLLLVTPDLATLKPEAQLEPPEHRGGLLLPDLPHAEHRHHLLRDWRTAGPSPPTARRRATSTRRRRAAPTTTGSRPSAPASTSRRRSARSDGVAP